MSDDMGREAGARSGMDVSALRRSCVGSSLDRQDLDDDPFRQFERWFRQACDDERPDPNAMSLATVDDRQRPACRTVLLKYFDSRGFVFFTNLGSDKAIQINDNPNVALLFFWPDLGRQVGVRGTAARVPCKEALRYFATRPRGSRLGAWVSAQSRVISSRSLLETKFDEMKRKFANREVPLPDFWGGYRVAPDEFEFWQCRTNRLHDRFRYTRTGADAWEIARLAP